jgi:hypothetical protein
VVNLEVGAAYDKTRGLQPQQDRSHTAQVMKIITQAAPALAAGAACLILAGCGSSSDPGQPSANGPLGGTSQAGFCYRFSPGVVYTDAMMLERNSSGAPVTITGAWLTGARDVSVDAVYADVVPFGDGQLGPETGWYGWPPRSLRHRAAGTVVKPGKWVVFEFVVTGHSARALFTGEDVSYASGSQSWTEAGTLFLGPVPSCQKP